MFYDQIAARLAGLEERRASHILINADKGASAAERDAATQAATDGSVWLFSSSEAIGNLVAACPGQDWGRAKAVVTHARIAQAAREAGFPVVCESRPTLAALMASIESLG